MLLGLACERPPERNSLLKHNPLSPFIRYCQVLLGSNTAHQQVELTFFPALRIICSDEVLFEADAPDEPAAAGVS